MPRWRRDGSGRVPSCKLKREFRVKQSDQYRSPARRWQALGQVPRESARRRGQISTIARAAVGCGCGSRRQAKGESGVAHAWLGDEDGLQRRGHPCGDVCAATMTSRGCDMARSWRCDVFSGTWRRWLPAAAHASPRACGDGRRTFELPLRPAHSHMAGGKPMMIVRPGDLSNVSEFADSVCSLDAAVSCMRRNDCDGGP